MAWNAAFTYMTSRGVPYEVGATSFAIDFNGKQPKTARGRHPTCGVTIIACIPSLPIGKGFLSNCPKSTTDIHFYIAII